MRRKTSILIGCIIFVVLAGAAFGAGYLSSVKRYQDTVSQTAYNNLDASGLPDGTYIGEYDVQFIYAKVEVTVVDGRITAITLLEHRHDRGIAAEGIEQRIIAEQKVDVDVVAGATNSSTVIKKAVDNALSQALRK